MPQNATNPNTLSASQKRELFALKADLIRLKIKLEQAKQPHRSTLLNNSAALLGRYGAMIPEHLILRLLKLPAKRKYRLLGSIGLFFWRWWREQQRYSK